MTTFPNAQRSIWRHDKTDDRQRQDAPVSYWRCVRPPVPLAARGAQRPDSSPLLTERKILYAHLGNRYEQAKRPRAGHPRSAPLENPGAGALARVGYQSPPEIHLRG